MCSSDLELLAGLAAASFRMPVLDQVTAGRNKLGAGLDRRGSRCGGANSDEGGKGESGEAFHSDFLRVAKRAAILNT